MPRNYASPDDDFDELDAPTPLPRIKSRPPAGQGKNGKPRPLRKDRRDLQQQIELSQAQENSMQALEYSYQASRHEHQWIVDSLTGFYQQHWFDDILRLLKGGKEASVYLCSGHPSTGKEFIAAKIYRPRRFRNLKNDHLYREGRDNLDSSGNVIINDGMLHAMRKRTSYGLELLHASWIEHEYQTMKILHAAGCDLPTPYASGNNAILMDYIGDRDTPAPTLNGIHLTSSEARPLFQRVLHNVEVMLAHNRIHADLSAYNILYWQGAITLIDFPQAVHPEQNHSAFRIFERDVVRVCEYFSRQGVRADGHKLASKLWTAHHHRLYPVADPKYLDDADEADRRYWETYKAE